MDDQKRINELERWERMHQELATEVSNLERRAFLTPEEQRRITHLKKQKLAAKDRLFELRRAPA
ncbi:MAG: DUF465 domain-containing protein [Myxococcales bacterium]|jgi:uncharacterized protein YdcH (DUF465 family)|nr:DUF465 domain-containing protein [Myxococcales bacterium]